MGDFTLESASIDVLGIGLCTVDLLFAVPHVPQFDHSMRASQFLRQGGGPAATALVTFARLAPGARGAFIGKVGDDEDSDFIRNSLEQQGIDIGHFAVARGAQSRVALVLVEESSGERGFVTRPESCGELAPSDLSKKIVSSARIVHLDDADATCMQAAIWAREAGRTVVFDGTWMHEDLEAFLPWVDVSVVSEPLVRCWLPELSPVDVVKKLSEHGAHLVVYTRGARGCVAHWDNETHFFPAFPTEVVDTTGAGDAFHEAVLYGLYRQWAPEQTIRFASATAALNCRALGGRTALPKRAEVELFLSENEI